MTGQQIHSIPKHQARSLRRLAWLMFTPVALLTGIGVYFLASDRKFAQQKAERDAETYLKSLVQTLELDKLLSPELRLEDGRLIGLAAGMEPEAVIVRRGSDHTDIFPPPRPQDDPAPIFTLPQNLFPAWTRAEQAEFEGNTDAAINAYRTLSTNEHQQVSLHSRYRLGLLTLRNGQPDKSDQILENLVAATPASNPLHRRAYWHLVQGFMTKRHTRYHPGTNTVTKACHAWSTHPDSESRDLLQRLAKRCEEMKHNIFTPIVTAAIRRVERDDRARELSAEIHSPKWRVRSYAVNSTSPSFVMVRRIDHEGVGHPHELLVVWRPHQLFGPLWRHLDRHSYSEQPPMPDVPDNIVAFGFGHSRMTSATRTWNTPAALKSADRVRRVSGKQTEIISHGEPTETLATISVGGFDLSVSGLKGAALAESNKRIVWFAVLILSAAGISGFAWRHTRRSVLELSALNEQKSNFVSSVSHELRTPVASMQLMAESLEAGKVTDDAKRHEYHGLILQECRRLGSLVHNVLDYSRIEQRRKEYEFTDSNLTGLVNNVVRLMEPRADEQEIRIVCATEPIEAILDTEAIQQALINVIDNAIKFSPDGSEIRLNLARNGDTHASISIVDQGVGIPEADRQKVFERFYRRENELRRETKGVGIGLSIVHHIVEAHSGKVKIDANDPTGCNVMITIPLNQTENASAT